MSNDINSEVNEEVIESRLGIKYPSPFDEYVLTLCRNSRRCLRIQSPTLDFQVFDNRAIYEAITQIARRSRHTWVRILVTDSGPMVKRNHCLLELARRMSTSITLRKLEEHPQWNGETLLVGDTDKLLYMPTDSNRGGAYHPDSPARAKRHLEDFDSLWELGKEDPALRQMYL